VVRIACVVLAFCGGVHAQESTREQVTTIAALFPADEAKTLAKTLPIDQALHFRVRIPQNAVQSGVLVFVKPTDDGELPGGWSAALDRRNLIWIAAEGFGNEHPRAQRVLAAMAAVKLAERLRAIDTKRIYVAGMSGGGRVASTLITRFPRLFTGALYIVGADFWTPAEESLLPGIVARRYVFVTGSRDFNRREMRRVFGKYQAAGASQSLLMDLPRFGHEYPNAEQLETALSWLDDR
jgi:predicted esterase